MNRPSTEFVASDDSPCGETAYDELVAVDLRLIRQDMQSLGPKLSQLLHASFWRSLIHLTFDWVLVFGVIWATQQVGWSLLPLTLLILGNRQRALGNVLHDGGHRNISRNVALNDFIANAFVAPLLFNDFSNYRKTHLSHHMHLGDPKRDPDILRPLGQGASMWQKTYVSNLFQAGKWWSSIAGDLATRMPIANFVYLVLWWATLLALVGLTAGRSFAGAFFLLWIASKATVFHWITTFREMCDHFGRVPGGIFGFTRDVSTNSFLRWIIHPRYNGYHLTHHLMPTVPYYNLAKAHVLFMNLSVFRRRACVCDSYFWGERSVLHHQPACEVAQ